MLQFGSSALRVVAWIEVYQVLQHDICEEVVISRSKFHHQFLPSLRGEVANSNNYCIEKRLNNRSSCLRLATSNLPTFQEYFCLNFGRKLVIDRRRKLTVFPFEFCGLLDVPWHRWHVEAAFIIHAMKSQRKLLREKHKHEIPIFITLQTKKKLRLLTPASLNACHSWNKWKLNLCAHCMLDWLISI